LLRTYSRYEEWLNRQTLKGIPRKLLEHIVRIYSVHGLGVMDSRQSASVMKEELERAGYEVVSLEMEMEMEEERGYDMEVWVPGNGQGRVRIGYDFLHSMEFKKLLEFYEHLALLHEPPYLVVDGENQQKFVDPKAFFQYLMDEARKGLTIQRYKGLGEMNPGQLWETTMNPEKRTLLQVRIEDQYLADELFTTLMGDKVEPRRDFIQINALDFRELDI
jgi:DNA gyrase subunit B